MRVTLNDIAKKAGISISTVSRVLNKHSSKYRISRETERRVQTAARELNYRPNQLARGLRLRKTHTVGLMVPDISNPFFAYIIRSIQGKAHDAGYSLVVCDTNEDLDLEVEHTKLLYSKGVDGLIVMPVGRDYHHLEEVIKNGVPLVVMDRVFDDLKADSVFVDNHRGALEAVDYLTKNGHTRIGIIQGLPGTFTATNRLRGYKEALERSGIEIDERLIVGRDFRSDNGYTETKLLLRIEKPPTALFTTSDLITLGALRAIDEERLSIPEDISVVGFDDIEGVQYFQCPITTVAQPREAMGDIAVKLLLDQIKSSRRNEPRKIVLQPRLIIRESVQPIRESAAAV
jgi:LacI family transcriptional regulator